MLNKQFRVVILLIFLLTTTLIVVLQYNANKNINELVTGNENLLTEFSMRNRLQELRNGVLSLDNETRSLVAGKDSSRQHMEKNVASIKAIVNELGALLVTDSNRILWNRLNKLSAKKISTAHSIIQTLDLHGRDAADSLLQQNSNATLNEEIEAISSQLDEARQTDLARIIRETDANSLQAKQFEGVLAIVAVIIVMLTLWYVVNRIRKQLSMITMLNESERKVREAALVKEHFIANISHEIRTPLNAIIGFTRLLKKQPLDSNAAEYVASISSGSENLLRIINDVLDLSKIEAGMMRLENIPVSIRTVVNTVFNVYASKAKEKNLRYYLHIEDKLHDTYLADPVRLTQVLANLLSNAIKFTHSGFVGMHVSDASNGSISFTIIDSGIGINPDQKDQIFERFTQADEHTTRKFGGTGLGLSIVKQIVDLMQGYIEVNKTETGGSSFAVTLPLEKISNQELVNEKTHHTELLPMQVQKKVLVVEDNVMNQSLMKHLLGNWQVVFDIAPNGKEAIDKVNTNKYDLVLMDVQMPEMDGYTAAQILRREMQITTPIIAMTAHAFAGEKEKCISYGMDDYISKPIQEDELYDIMRKYLDNEKEIRTYTNNDTNIATCINLTYLDELANGNIEFKKNILGQFLVQAPEEIAVLEAAEKRQDMDAVRATAHNLKTTLSFLGLDKILKEELNLLQEKNHPPEWPEISRCKDAVLTVCQQALDESRHILSAL